MGTFEKPAWALQEFDNPQKEKRQERFLRGGGGGWFSCISFPKAVPRDA